MELWEKTSEILAAFREGLGLISEENTAMRYMLLYYLVVNVIAFFMYALDKSRAVHHKWRITERVLLLIAIIGGAIGALLGMIWFRHKTLHLQFRVIVPVFMMLHGAIILYLLAKAI